MPHVDYEAAGVILEDVFTELERRLSEGKSPQVLADLAPHFDRIFSSTTAAFRETLLGCVLAHLQDEGFNIRKPYIAQGADAFNGRTLDERVVNPFLQSKEIPCSKGPYLSVFRRNVMFDQTTRKGIRDKIGYDAFDSLLSYLESSVDTQSIREFLVFLLWKFVELRESSKIVVSKLHRISLSQYHDLIDRLLVTPSGGRLPVLLTLAAFRTIREYFKLDWAIEFQEINVADSASGAGGDITIKALGQPILAVEVTERPVEASRVQSTFRTKIAPLGIEDYLFLVDLSKVQPEAKVQAHNYFAQGHEVNFLDFKDWIIAILGTIGVTGRRIFNTELTQLLDGPTVPKGVKVAWNKAIVAITVPR